VRTSTAHLALRARLHPVRTCPLRFRGSLPLHALLYRPLANRYRRPVALLAYRALTAVLADSTPAALLALGAYTIVLAYL